MMRASCHTNKNNDDLTTLFETMDLGVVYQDSEGNITRANPAAEKILGLTLNQMLGRTSMHPEWRTVDENGKDLPGEKHAAMVALRTKKKVKNSTMGVYNPKLKDYVWILVNSVPQFHKGDKKPYQVFTTFSDITLQKQKEQEVSDSEYKFKLLADNTTDWEYWIDENGKFIYLSPACEAITGYSKEVCQKNPKILQDIVLPEHSEFVKNHYKNSGIHKDDATFELKIKHKDGSTRWVEHSCSKVIDENGIYRGRHGTNRDLTERKIAEYKLQKNEEKFRNLYSNSPFGIMICKLLRDSEGNIIDFIHVEGNPSIETQTGFKLNDLLGKKSSEIVGDEIAKDLTKKYGDVVTKNQPISFEQYFDIYNRTLNVNAFAFYGDFFIINFIDISKRKKVENELKAAKEKAEQNKAKLDSALDSMSDAIFISDEKGHFIDFNEAFATFHKFNNKAECAKTLIEYPLFLNVYDLSGEILPVEMWVVSRALRGEKGTNEIYTLELKDTGEKWMGSYNYAPIRNNIGEIVGSVVSARDVTEKIKIEEELVKAKERAEASEARLLDSQAAAKLGSWQTDLSDLKVYWTNEIFNIFEIDPKTFQPTHQAFLEFVHPEDRQSVDDAFVNSLNTDEYNSVKHRIITAKGTTKFVEERWRSIKNEQGDPIIAIGTCLDITEQKKAEDELIIAKEKAEESDRLKSAFLANMSHEIRTPMNGILGFTDLLKEANLTGDERQKYIDVIEKSGDRMLNTINDIIDFSRIESGEVVAHFKPTNINTQLEALYDFFKPEAEKKNIKLCLEPGLDDNSANILTDPEKFDAIFTNLIKNALKFTPKGFIEFGYTLKGEIVHFYVKDSGLGIDSYKREKIFERFIQEDDSHTRVQQGSGLGLSIVKAYVELLEGKIWVESVKEEGSIFHFTIPYQTIKEGSSTKVTDGRNTMDKKNSYTNKTVLIVEDDETSYEYLEAVIKNFGVDNIILARNGKEAVKQCIENPNIDLVLMDINMPLMNGYEATRAIKAIRSDLSVIAQTAYTLSGDQEKSIEAGCDDYITKPVKKEELLDKMEKFLS